MPLEFGDDFCPPCEPSAWIWHEGNGPIGIAVIAVVDVDLPEIHIISLVHWNIHMITILPTLLNVLLLATKWWAPARTFAPLMLRYWRWRGSR
jgi:hypothetical protein